jgi:hypothetical protein
MRNRATCDSGEGSGDGSEDTLPDANVKLHTGEGRTGSRADPGLVQGLCLRETVPIDDQVL